MAGGLLKYSALAAKTRAMGSRLLSRKDFGRITEFRTVQETISFLQEQESYGRIYGGREEIKHRGQVEELIHDSIREDYRKLCRFADAGQRRAMGLYMEQLRLRGMSSEADIAYFVKAWEEIGHFKGKRMRRILREIFGTQIDWLNIMWIYRARHFFRQSPEAAGQMLIPVRYKLKKEECRMLLEAMHAGEFRRILSDTSYYRGRDALVKVEDEVSYHDVMGKMYARLCRRYPFSIALELRYLYEKEQEIEHLTTALEGIRYQLAPKDIREMILPRTPA